MGYPQSTAYTVTMKVYSSTDHTSDGTGLTMAVKISKAGGAFGNPSAGAVNATELSNGWYTYSLSTTDTNTLGDLVVRLTGTNADASERILPIVKATNGGLTALPDTAVSTNASLITSGTGTDQVSVSSGKVLLQATQTGVTIPTVTTVTNGVTVTTNNDKTGYTLSQAFPSNFASMLISAGGIVTANATQIAGTSTTGLLVSTGVFSTGALANAPSGGGGGGSGANTVTITVTDLSSVPLQNATVTALASGIVNGTGLTDVNGQTVLALNNATYDMNVTCLGYGSTHATLAVSGTTSHTYQLGKVVITPSDPPTVTGWLIALDAGVPTGGITHTLTMTKVPNGDTGSSFEADSRTATSASNGLVEFTGLIPGAQYQITRSTGNPFLFTASTSDFSIADCIG